MKRLPPFRFPGRFVRPGLAWEDSTPIVESLDVNYARLTGGVAVTITGRRFETDASGTAPTVTFGGNAATSVVVVNKTTITCVAPAASAAGVVDVTVTNWRGQSGTLAAAFVYIAAVIFAVRPYYGPLAGGTEVLIEGANFLPGSAVLFGGNAASGITFIDSQHIRCVTPNHAVGFVDVEVIEPA